jgi:hypothetical protein
MAKPAPKSDDLVPLLRSLQKADSNPADVIAWLVTQPNANGTLYLERVVRSYMSTVRNAPQRLILNDSEPRNVFACHKVADLDKLAWDVFRSAPNYAEVNRYPGHGQLSAGLAVYRRYLEHLERDVAYDITTPPVSPLVAQEESHGIPPLQVGA